MKKIDLHIHTVVTVSDADFTFSLDKFKSYVTSASLDAVAITNHNVFDLAQFKVIDSELGIKVFPGIEINLESGHLLLISENRDLDDFNTKCSKVTSRIQHATDCLSVHDLKSIFPSLDEYLLIPHYDKKPAIKGDTLTKIEKYVSAGEVDSAKKFIRHWKDSTDLTPVLFSDARIAEFMEDFPTRHTFVDCGDITMSSLKACFNDREKVALSENDGNDLFQIFDNGQKLSTGLNILLGERSSGKTWTLDRIYKLYENTKYIKQFSLVQKDEEACKKRFNEDIARDKSIFTERYLMDYKSVVTDILSIDWHLNDRLIANYLQSLLKAAEEEEKKDSYSEAVLFTETLFNIRDKNVLSELISSVRQVIENIEYRPIIEKHIDLDALKALACELIELLRAEHLERRKKVFVNSIINDVKEGLKLRSSATLIEDVDLYRIQIELQKIRKFNQLTRELRKPGIIFSENVQGFQIVASKGAFSGSGEVKNVSGLKVAFSDAFEEYENPYKYLTKLKGKESLTPSEFYKYFIKIEYRILNKDGNNVSGGERSEFRLLQEIKDSQNYDLLLIDEPESSFDNIFLKGEVNQIIKDISKTMPVVVVTHNSTVGASIGPDFVLYAQKTYVEKRPTFQLFSGHPMDKHLTTTDGLSITNYDITINSLEAGSPAYEERMKKYENLKN